MTLKDIKLFVENKSKINSSIVFEIEDDSSYFVIQQYLKKYSADNNLIVEYISDVNTMDENALFDTVTNYLYVLKLDTFDNLSVISNNTNLWVICNKSSFEDNIIIKVPKLERWQIEEYASVLLGCNTIDAKVFCEKLGYDIYKIYYEATKVSIFDNDKAFVYNSLLRENDFNFLPSSNIYGVINAITRKNTRDIAYQLSLINLEDVNAIGFTTLLLNNFKNICDIQLSKNPTPESTGLSVKQFSAIKFNTNKYSAKQLIKIMQFLYDVDSKLKTGYLPYDNIVIYDILNILAIGNK